MRTIAQIAILVLILITLFASGCTDPGTQNENVAINEDNATTNNYTDTEDGTDTEDNTDLKAVSSNEEDTNIKNDESPVSIFTENDISAIGADGFTGTDNEIAISILNWQQNNMIYAGAGTNYNDVSYSMRWNYAFPNIFTSKDMIENMKDGNQFYGICYNYATIYASIAEYYGLEVRITNTVEKPSEISDNPFYKATATGMGTDEYNELISWVRSKGMNAEDYPYEAVRLVMSETAVHYRAEVLIDGEWKRMDQYDSNTDGADEQYSFVVTNWNEGNKQDELINYVQRIRSGDDLKGEGYSSGYEEFLEARLIRIENNELEDYVGITDDLGNKNRAANIDDLMQGYGLAPYFNNEQDVIDFFNDIPVINEDVGELFEIKDDVESNSNEVFYVVCDFIIFESETIDEDVYLEQYYVFSGEIMSSKVFDDHVK